MTGITHGMIQLAERYGLIVLLLAMAVFFTFFTDNGDIFISSANMRVVLSNIAVVTIVALAILLPLVAGNLDFTVGAVAGVASTAAAAAMSDHGAGLLVAVLIALAVGASFGLTNGLIVAYLGVNSFIYTLGVSILLGGAVQWYTGGVDIIGGMSRVLTSFGSGTVWGVPQPFVLVLGLTLACWFALTNTVFGRRLRAIGSNHRAASLIGIDTRAVVLRSFVASGFLAGIAGIVLVARNGGAVTNAGSSQLFPAFAAVFLGATTIDPGRYNALGTFVGVLFVGTAVSGLTLAGAASWAPAVFNGSTLVIAVVLSTILARQRQADT